MTTNGDLYSSWLFFAHTIKFIKIIDAVGSLNSLHGSIDSKGKKINDPWPTPWPASGFDLDAVALLSPGFTGQDELVFNSATIYPNPSRQGAKINIGVEGINQIELLDALGKTLSVVQNQNSIFAPEQSGVYQLRIATNQGVFYSKLCVR